jgi:hypothetical protein
MPRTIPTLLFKGVKSRNVNREHLFCYFSHGSFNPGTNFFVLGRIPASESVTDAAKTNDKHQHCPVERAEEEAEKLHKFVQFISYCPVGPLWLAIGMITFVV